MPYSMPSWVQVVAHRANSGPAPENTVRAIESAIELGVDMVEVDVRVTKDMVPVLLHGPYLDHTTSGRGPVADHTWAELCRLDAGQWKDRGFGGEQVPSLNEALSVTGGRVALNLDIKTPAAIGPAVDAVRNAGLTDEVVMSGCTEECVKSMKLEAPEFTTLLNVEEVTDGDGRAEAHRGVDVAGQLGVKAINLNHRLVDADLMEEA